MLIQKWKSENNDLCCSYSLPDITWWRHQMETVPALLVFARGIHRSPVGSPHKGQWCGALMFSLICTWTNGSANNRDAGDLRGHRAHHDVTVILIPRNTDIRLQPLNKPTFERGAFGKACRSYYFPLFFQWLPAHIFLTRQRRVS